MKQVYFFLFAVLLTAGLTGCEPAKKDRCTDFKTGTFKFLKPGYEQFTIVRTENEQTEIDSVSGLRITGDVNWTSDCKYTVTFTKVSDPKYESVIGTKTDVQILAIFDDRLTCKTQGLGGTMEVEMVKIAP